MKTREGVMSKYNSWAVQEAWGVNNVSSSLLRPYLYLQKPLKWLSANWTSICLEPENLRTATTHTLKIENEFSNVLKVSSNK